MSALLAPSPLRFVTRTLPHPPADLLDALGSTGFAWHRDGLELVTAGVAARVAPARAAAVLAQADSDHPFARPGTGPLAVGALPFRDAAAGELVVPAIVVGRDAHGTWITKCDDAVTAPRAAYSATSRARVVAVHPDRAAWEVAVAAVLDAIAGSALEKVVLARQLEVEATGPIDARALLAHLRQRQPGCFVFADGDFVGATPELLVRRVGHAVSACPMAGTAPRDRAAVLAGSGKDAREHQLVVDAVVAGLRERCDAVRAGAPEPARFTDVAHLATPVHALVRETGTTALDLALALHPTPAVAGTPRDAALAQIEALEPFERDRYAGPVGWIDARGDGEFAVALRCARLDGYRAVLNAGAGIVAGSEPAAEWDETETKLAPMLDALGAAR